MSSTSGALYFKDRNRIPPYASISASSTTARTLIPQALYHASYHVERKLEISWVDAEDLDSESMHKNASKHEASWALVKAADGILVPGGFGDRGVEGKIACAKWARESKKPYLGVCLGFQARLHHHTAVRMERLISTMRARARKVIVDVIVVSYSLCCVSQPCHDFKLAFLRWPSLSTLGRYLG